VARTLRRQPIGILEQGAAHDVVTGLVASMIDSGSEYLLEHTIALDQPSDVSSCGRMTPWQSCGVSVVVRRSDVIAKPCGGSRLPR
jgi:hypothetical protein